MDVGKRELLGFAERHSGAKVTSYNDLATGDVLCRLFSTVFPSVSLVPAHPSTASVSQQKHHNWGLITRACHTLGVPPSLLDRRAIEAGNAKKCASALVLFYFLYQLCRDGNCSIQFTVDVSPELTEFVQSPSSVRALVIGGGMPIEAVPGHLRGLLGDLGEDEGLSNPIRREEASLRGSEMQQSQSNKDSQHLFPTLASPQVDSPPPPPPTVESQKETMQHDAPDKDAIIQQLIDELEGMHDELDHQIHDKAAIREDLEMLRSEYERSLSSFKDLTVARDKLQEQFETMRDSKAAVEEELRRTESSLEAALDELARTKKVVSESAWSPAMEKSAVASTSPVPLPFEMTSPSSAESKIHRQASVTSAGWSAARPSSEEASPQPSAPSRPAQRLSQSSAAQKRSSSMEPQNFIAATNVIHNALLDMTADYPMREQLRGVVEDALFDISAAFALLQERVERHERDKRDLTSELKLLHANLDDARLKEADLIKELSLQRTAAEHLGAAAALSEAACRERMALADRECQRMEREMKRLAETHQEDIQTMRNELEARYRASRSRIVQLEELLHVRDRLCLALRQQHHQNASGHDDNSRDIDQLWQSAQLQERGTEPDPPHRREDDEEFHSAISAEFRELMSRCIQERDASRAEALETAAQNQRLEAQLAAYSAAISAERKLRKQYETELQSALDAGRAQAVARISSEASAKAREVAMKEQLVQLEQLASEGAVSSVRRSASTQLRSPYRSLSLTHELLESH